MNNIKLKIGIIIFSSLFVNFTFGQNDSSKVDRNELIIGKWFNKINRTLDGKEYFGLKCRDTIQYLSNGKYIKNQCVWDETGKWKFSDKKDLIIHFDIDNKYWKKRLGTDDLGESHAKIISLSESEFVTVLFDEEKGEIHKFYVRLE